MLANVGDNLQVIRQMVPAGGVGGDHQISEAPKRTVSPKRLMLQHINSGAGYLFLRESL